MPEEIMAIIIIAIIAGTITSLTKLILSHREKTAGYRSGVGKAEQAESGSLTTSELERMLDRVVKKATNPILDRLEDLEDRLEQVPPLALPEKGERIELDEGPAERESAMAAPRRRVR